MSTTVTMKDVAERAGVSVATVSRVFSGRDNVKPVIASRVHEVAKAMGYRMNTAARSLRTNSNKMIAFVCPDVANPYFTDLARGVEEIANKAGHSLLLCNSDDSATRERTYFELIQEQRCAGVVVAPYARATDVTGLLDHQIPVVVVDSPVDADVDIVVSASHTGARQAVTHLLDEGWKRPGIVTGPVDTPTAEWRLGGYLSALAEAGELDPVVARARYREAEGKAATHQLLTSDGAPDALLVANAAQGLGALSAIQELGLSVGHDIGFAMFDDPAWARYWSPSITTVVQPSHQIGSTAATLLLDIIERQSVRERQIVELATELVIRDSSRRRPG